LALEEDLGVVDRARGIGQQDSSTSTASEPAAGRTRKVPSSTNAKSFLNSAIGLLPLPASRFEVQVSRSAAAG